MVVKHVRASASRIWCYKTAVQKLEPGFNADFWKTRERWINKTEIMIIIGRAVKRSAWRKWCYQKNWVILWLKIVNFKVCLVNGDRSNHYFFLTCCAPLLSDLIKCFFSQLYRYESLKTAALSLSALQN